MRCGVISLVGKTRTNDATIKHRNNQLYDHSRWEAEISTRCSREATTDSHLAPSRPNIATHCPSSPYVFRHAGDVYKSLYLWVRACTRLCSAHASLAYSVLSKLEYLMTRPRAAYDSNSSSSSIGGSSDGAGGRETRTPRSGTTADGGGGFCEGHRRGMTVRARGQWKPRGRIGKGGSSLHVMHLNMYRDNARREDLRGSQGSRMEWSAPECFRQFVYHPSVSRLSPWLSLSLSLSLALLLTRTSSLWRGGPLALFRTIDIYEYLPE